MYYKKVTVKVNEQTLLRPPSNVEAYTNRTITADRNPIKVPQITPDFFVLCHVIDKAALYNV